MEIFNLSWLTPVDLVKVELLYYVTVDKFSINTNELLIVFFQ